MPSLADLLRSGVLAKPPQDAMTGALSKGADWGRGVQGRATSLMDLLNPQAILGQLSQLPQMAQQVSQFPSGPPSLGEINNALGQALNMSPGVLGTTAYHGSPNKFAQFDMSKAGTGASKGLLDDTAGVIWATKIKGDADLYAAGRTQSNPYPEKGAGYVYKLDVKPSNPYYYLDRNTGTTTGDRAAAIKYARENGHDAVIFAATKKDAVKNAEIAILDPQKVSIVGD